MTDALAITELSMHGDMRRLDLIAHNLANANTSGFKRDFAVTHSFDSYFNFEVKNSTQGGLSAPQFQQLTDFRNGAFKYTGNPLDMAIEGKGFLELSTPSGTMYTRQGTLALDASGRLVTANGYVINGMDGPIRLRSSEAFIDKQGKIWEGEELMGQLKISVTDTLDDMVKIGEGLYQSNREMKMSSGDSNTTVRQGYVETSNVITMNEMVHMMETMRHFELSQKLVKAYDEMQETAMSKIGDF